VDDRLLDAAIEVLESHGYEGLTLERVAEAAGRSRVTLWRQQVTQDALIDGLLARLTRDYRDAVWSAVVDAGTGAARLRTAIGALLDVAERHRHLLAVSSDVFDRAESRVRDITGQPFRFVDPFASALRAGVADGSVPDPGVSTQDYASALFHSHCWGYIHLRVRENWPAERARGAVVALARLT
jgi:AcrR family transcriptional regulator